MKTYRLILIVLIAACIRADATAQTNMNVFPNAGNAGIGTTSPSFPLQVYSATSHSEVRVTSAAADAGHVPAFSMSNPSTTWSLGLTDGLGLNIRENSAGYASRLFFANGGNVGIGTTTPTALLNLARFATYAETLGSSNNPALRISNTNSSNFSEKAEIQFAVGGGTTVTAAISAYYSDWQPPGGSSVGSDLVFSTKAANSTLIEGMRISKNGMVGIGTSNPTQKLSVNGTVRAKEVIVETTGWSDYVFGDEYQLTSLSTLEEHIKRDKHLPGMPSAAEVAQQGIGLGEMQAKLLAKIEELTLHVIAQQKQLERQAEEIKELRGQARASSSPVFSQP